MPSSAILLWTTTAITASLLCTFAGALMLADAEKCTPSMQDLTLMMSWKNIQWPEEQAEENAESAGNFTDNAYGEPYDESAIIPTRMQMWGTQVFLTFPRYRPGIPFSLGYVLLTSSNRFDTEIYPFPSWLEHTRDSYASIVNAVDIYLDHKNLILWVLDTGEINTLEKPQRIAPPRIFGVHVTDKKVIEVIDLSDMVCPESRLQFLVADATDVSSTNLFVSDAGSRSLLVYKGAMTSDSRGFRVQLPPLLCLKSTGCKQDVLHLMISGGGGGGDCSDSGQPRLYFSYLSGEYLFSAPAKDLSEGKTFASVSQVGLKPGRMVFVGSDGDLGSNLFFRLQQPCTDEAPACSQEDTGITPCKHRDTNIALCPHEATGVAPCTHGDTYIDSFEQGDTGVASCPHRDTVAAPCPHGATCNASCSHGATGIATCKHSRDSRNIHCAHGDTTIYTWHAANAFQSDSFAVRDAPGSCRQATSVTSGYKGMIWALESNIWDYLYGSVGSMGAGAWIRPLSKICQN